MINLLSNAVKFSPSGQGRVEVDLAATADALQVTVADNGPGVQEGDRQIIFEKFRQGGDALTGKPQGTGLGLPISRQIVEHFGGRLWVEAAAEDGASGARFVFSLPLRAAAAGSEEGAREQEDTDSR